MVSRWPWRDGDAYAPARLGKFDYRAALRLALDTSFIYRSDPQKVDSLPDRVALWFIKPVGEFDHLFLKQARLLERYEAQALARRKRAIAAFDRLACVALLRCEACKPKQINLSTCFT